MQTLHIGLLCSEKINSCHFFRIFTPQVKKHSNIIIIKPFINIDIANTTFFLGVTITF